MGDFIVVETAAGPDQGKGYVQIYTSAFGTLLGKFEEAANKGIVYQWGVWKNTFATMPDTTQFKKRTANNGKDNGKYAANQALLIKAAGMGCRSTCLTADNANAPNKPPIKQDSQGTSVTGQCAPCAKFFQNLQQATRPAKPVPPTQPPPPVSGIVQTGSGQEIALPDRG